MTEREYKNPRTDQRPTQYLLEEFLEEVDIDKGWEAVVALHFRGTRDVLEASAHLLTSSEPRRRKLGADILGQLGVPVRTFPVESFELLADAMGSERDPTVLAAIAIAFGHLENPSAIPLLLPLIHDPDPSVREAVTVGLLGHEDRRAIDALIRLSQDESEEVRDWATFALGTQIDRDDEKVRSALLERLDDPHRDTRCEALVGLAKRKDRRVLSAIARELQSEEVGDLAIEAAELLAEPSLVGPLSELKLENPEWEELETAIDACIHGRHL
jgi:HEAT repeat protein